MSDTSLFAPQQMDLLGDEAEQLLTGEEWVKRAYMFRDKARTIFNEECEAVYANSGISDDKKDLLRKYKLLFDRGTTRRGVCKYPSARTGGIGYIGLSSSMIDRGVSAQKVAQIIRHEISHACNPGHHHDATWKAFDILIGGDGKRCCTDEEVKKLIGHKVEVYCPVGGASSSSGHYFAKKQKAPSNKQLTTKCCGACKKKGIISRLVFRRI